MSSPNLDVRDVARLARIELTDEEAATFQSQLGRVLEYVEQLNALDVSSVEPTAHANPVFNVLRADEARPGLERNAAKNCATLTITPRQYRDLLKIRSFS